MRDDGDRDRRKRDVYSRLPIGELITWHLWVNCPACRRDSYVKIGGLADRFGEDAKLVTLLPKLRCRTPGCGLPPDRVRLRNKFPAHPGPAMIDVVLL